MDTRACEQCGRQFNPVRRTRRFCSKTCSNIGAPRGQAVKRLDGPFYERTAERVNQSRNELYRSDPEYRKRVLARVAARKAHPVKRPCSVCGNPKADRHHRDYDKPLEIEWLCRSCHIQHHAAELGTWGEGLSVR